MDKLSNLVSSLLDKHILVAFVYSWDFEISSMQLSIKVSFAL